MRILVTGISGFIGGSLAPRLLERGHEVVGLARSADRVDPALRDSVEIVEGDALEGRSLEQAMEGCDSFAWLLHSMEPDASGTGYSERELHAVRRALGAARSQGVERAVYLGGIVPETGPESEHLSSRLAVERELLRGLPDSTALRASIVIGARSRSFRFLVRLVERMPALPLPAWRTYRTRPADSRDTIVALTEALEGAAPGASLDISCAETVSYAELIELIAERMLVGRPAIGLPFSLTPIAGRVAAAVTGEQPELIVPLMGSLGEDLLPRMDGLARLGIRPHRLDAAIDRSLREWEEIEELRAR
jgi:nucleoside-diphosphate-sugar epimerase